MKLTNTTSAIALLMALSGGLVSGQALADLPSPQVDIRTIDTNKNGKVEKDEYLAFMAKEFDKSAGKKGYCTFEEVNQGFEHMSKQLYMGGG
ncbi:MAG: EF-hand domain-containing protein [Candidatus Accumulibacter meliphilus]|jgi:hypothetical protein|uniref:EF-hand domain-containing protein n=1 Tax=Candidatus Accumulibacter meliphilus TaxID=2211374 RepID=UPI002FC3867D